MIKVIQSGIYTSIQDTGRNGYRNIGVPLSGSMDHISAFLANALLNNSHDDALMEITLTGPVLQFEVETSIVITGAEMSPTLNNNSIVNNKVYSLNSGDIIKFGKLTRGVRSYIGVVGGIQTKSILNSRSFFKGITSVAVVKKNDLISIIRSPSIQKRQFGLLKAQNPFYITNYLDVYKGPEFDLFTAEEQKRIFQTEFSVAINNRMGYNFENTIGAHTKSMLTSPVLPGTVQLLPNGKIIVLMKDAQTTGGYPRILQLTENSMAILSQKKRGDQIYFKPISFD